MLSRAFGVLLLALCVLAPAAAQAQATPNSRYIVFIHSGGGSAQAAQKVAVELARRGYVVRKPDNQRDTVGGPGVDYFSTQDAAGAAEVANIVSGALSLPEGGKLKPRLQRIKNPPGYLGVWLF
ncbi:MAG TPA: hypothetical protein VMV45_14925 [Casimicrobiaceae bacterium]|nr:hypothetical protein [Casimicrobiaceae bacterium]